MKSKFNKINRNLINIVLVVSIFILLSGVWDWVSNNSTLRGELLTIASGIIVILMVVLRIIHVDKIKKTIKGQLG